MRNPAKSTRYAARSRQDGLVDGELLELALLEEFNRSDSVAALAGAMSARLGHKARSNDMIAEALGALRSRPQTRLGNDGEPMARLNAL